MQEIGACLLRNISFVKVDVDVDPLPEPCCASFLDVHLTKASFRGHKQSMPFSGTITSNMGAYPLFEWPEGDCKVRKKHTGRMPLIAVLVFLIVLAGCSASSTQGETPGKTSTPSSVNTTDSVSYTHLTLPTILRV